MAGKDDHAGLRQTQRAGEELHARFVALTFHGRRPEFKAKLALSVCREPFASRPRFGFQPERNVLPLDMKINFHFGFWIFDFGLSNFELPLSIFHPATL